MVDIVKHIGQILTVYTGSAVTFLLTLVSSDGIDEVRGVLAICVAIATLIYTFYKIIEMRLNIKRIRRDSDD
jgi:Na+/alanine symporter